MSFVVALVRNQSNDIWIHIGLLAGAVFEVVLKVIVVVKAAHNIEHNKLWLSNFNLLIDKLSNKLQRIHPLK